jgi:hypothetical protein
MVEADSHLKLIPVFISDIYKVLQKTDMLSMGIQKQPHTAMATLYLAQIWGFLSLVESKCCQYMLVENDSHLKLIPVSI